MPAFTVRSFHCMCAALLLASSSAGAGLAQVGSATAAPTDHPRRDRPSVVPNPHRVALPAERDAMNEMFAGLAAANNAREALVIFDATLAKLSEPTKLRGFVEMLRAEALRSEGRDAEAIKSIEQSIRLLPGYAGPLIAAARIFAYSGEAGMGADYLLRASHLAPAAVRAIDDYEVYNILHRLSAAQDQRRLELVSERLLEIGWHGSRLGSVSRLAGEAIQFRLKRNDVAGARQFIPNLLVPQDSYRLLANKHYSALWPHIESWAGERLEKQWPIYFREAEARWAASRNVTNLRDYVEALVEAGHDERLIEEVLPLFSEDIDPNEDLDMIFVVAPLAGALAREGRWQDITALFDRGEEIWPLGRSANALNIAANRARYLLMAGRYQEAVERMNLAIGDARKWGAEVNRDALAAMHHHRACALHQLGNASEAYFSVRVARAVQNGVDNARLHLCTGDLEAARQALIAALQDPDQRDAVIGFLQKSSSRPHRSDYARLMKARTAELKNDPEVLDALEEHGRVLPFAINESAPRR